MMNDYREIAREAAETARRMTLKWDIITIVWAVLCTILIIIALRLIWIDWQDRKERKLGRVTGGNEFVPVVTETVQIGPDGTEYHRMGVPTARH